jgi:hypothetical protein
VRSKGLDLANGTYPSQIDLFREYIRHLLHDRGKRIGNLRNEFRQYV